MVTANPAACIFTNNIGFTYKFKGTDCTTMGLGYYEYVCSANSGFVVKTLSFKIHIKDSCMAPVTVTKISYTSRPTNSVEQYTSSTNVFLFANIWTIDDSAGGDAA